VVASVFRKRYGLRNGSRKISYLKEMSDQGYNSERIGSFHEFMLPWLLSSNNVAKNECVVDIGAGLGHGLIPLHHKGWNRLVAVDVEEYNFPLFREKYGITTALCNITSQRLDLESESAGAVLCFHVIEHLQDPDILLKEIYRVLKSNGILFLVTPDWRKQYKSFWRDPKHVHPYDKISIARILRIYRFLPKVFSWNSRYGLGRIKAYRWFPRLGMIGEDLIAICTKC